MDKDENHDFNLEVGSRINVFCSYLDISVNKFETILGVGVGSISKTISTGKAIGGKVLKKIILTYPNLNIDWLFTGRGQMLWNKENPSVLLFEEPREKYSANHKLSQNDTQVTRLTQDIEFLREQIKDLRYTIEMQKEHISILKENTTRVTKSERISLGSNSQ